MMSHSFLLFSFALRFTINDFFTLFSIRDSLPLCSRISTLLSATFFRSHEVACELCDPSLFLSLSLYSFVFVKFFFA